jgi:hypothetical protein
MANLGQEATGLPQGWPHVAHLAVKTSPATATAAAWGLGAEPSLPLLLAGAGALLFIYIVIPVSRALGRGWEYRIDQRMGTPSKREP